MQLSCKDKLSLVYGTIMAIFAVVSDRDNTKLFTRIRELFPADNLKKVDDHLIMVISTEDSTAKQLTVKIEKNGTPLKDYGRVVAFSISSYQGFHKKSLWEWLQGKLS